MTEVEVQEDASPILNRMVQAMSTGQSSATKAGTPNGKLMTIITGVEVVGSFD